MYTPLKAVGRESKVTLQPQECLCSYDVTALLTSVPVDPALKIIQDLLEQDNRIIRVLSA